MHQEVPVARFESPVTYTGLATAKRRRKTKSEEDVIIEQALAILRRRMVARDVFASPDQVKSYLQLAIARKDHEVFCAVFLDSQNRLIDFEELFRGTLAQTSVYPREVVKRALEIGAAAIIFAHNHPSGSGQPSRADEELTKKLKEAMALVDVRVLDHVIVAPGQALSMAEMGLI